MFVLHITASRSVSDVEGKVGNYSFKDLHKADLDRLTILMSEIFVINNVFVFIKLHHM